MAMKQETGSLAHVRRCYFCGRPAAEAPTRTIFGCTRAKVCAACATLRGMSPAPAAAAAARKDVA